MRQAIGTFWGRLFSLSSCSRGVYFKSAKLKPAAAIGSLQDSTLKRKIEVSQSTDLRDFKRPKMEQGFYGENHLIWIDCEMNELSLERGLLLEIACIITAPDLNEVSRHPSIVIQTPDAVLQSMEPWCMKTHGESGLIAACKESTITMAQAEQMLLTFVRNYTKAGTCPMAGNSIFWDRLLIMKHMPELYSHFHYRSIDVSSIKELVRRWYPKAYGESPTKQYIHRTLNDVEDSIAELQYYRAAAFRK